MDVDMGGFGIDLFLVWGLGLAVSIGVFVLVAWLAALVFRSVFRGDRYGSGRIGGREEPGAEEILRRRYARGEISREEFEEARRVLGS